jgi:polyisoprenoid-binding protein YceI
METTSRRVLIVVLMGALLASAALAAAPDGVFAPDDHCVAYRTVKGMFWAFDAEVVGRSCEVTAALERATDGSRIVAAVPVKSLDSDNGRRDGQVAEILGGDTHPELRFRSEPIDVAALRAELPGGAFELAGTLSVAGREYAVVFPLELSEHGGRHFVSGALETTFAALGVEIPSVGPGGMIAAPGEDVDVLVHLELERVDGLEAWARQQGLR